MWEQTSIWETSRLEQTCIWVTIIWKTNIWKQTRIVHFHMGADRRLSVLVVVCHIGLLPFSVLPRAWLIFTNPSPKKSLTHINIVDFGNKQEGILDFILDFTNKTSKVKRRPLWLSVNMKRCHFSGHYTKLSRERERDDWHSVTDSLAGIAENSQPHQNESCYGEIHATHGLLSIAQLAFTTDNIDHFIFLTN